MTRPSEVSGWLERLFRSIDEKDVDAFVNFLTPDASFRFGSAPAVQGHTAIREAVGDFFSTIAGCRHELRRTWHDDDSLVCEGTVTYRRHNGSAITLPFADVFVFCDGLIERYSIYADVNPLYDQT